jgi:L-serine dehydratase
MAAVSIFDIFKIGIGPSSSHTVGPMKAARAFAASLPDHDVVKIHVTLFGSLAWTGKGHGTDTAIFLGLAGYEPETIDPDKVEEVLDSIHKEDRIQIDFNYERELSRHTNGMSFIALDAAGDPLHAEDWYSLGGGFVARGDEPEASADRGEPPYTYTTSESLLRLADENKLSIAELMRENESTWCEAGEIDARIDAIWDAMNACVERGMHTEGVLPGKMAVLRRAAKLCKNLGKRGTRQPLDAMEWVNVYAIAVNEENAAGGRVVTSPTNGAAGIIPAVLRFYVDFIPEADQDGIRRFLLTAGAIGILYKVNASISGAEMGCQGEVGVACSMAAGGLAATLGGSNDHVEEAAEIGMEHNLGLTCDPIGGLVQIPCIERNAMGAVKAINAAKLAMHGDGTHKVTLDQVIETMRQTGEDMSTHYKETAQGGLAVNVPEC